MKLHIFLIVLLIPNLSMASGEGCKNALGSNELDSVVKKYLGSDLLDLAEMVQHQSSIKTNMEKRQAIQPAHYQSIRRQLYKLRAELDTGNLSGALTRVKSFLMQMISSYKVIRYFDKDPTSEIYYPEVKDHLVESANLPEHIKFLTDIQNYDLYRNLLRMLEGASTGESTQDLTDSIVSFSNENTVSTSREPTVVETSLDREEVFATRKKTAQLVIKELESINQDIDAIVPALSHVKIPEPLQVRRLVDRLVRLRGDRPALNRVRQKSELEKQARKLHTRDAFFEAFYNSAPGKMLGKFIYSKLVLATPILLGRPLLMYIQRLANDRFSYRHFDAIDQLVIDFENRGFETHYRFLQRYSAPGKFKEAMLVAYFRHLGTLSYRERFLKYVQKQGDGVFARKCEDALAFAKNHGVLDAFERNPLRHTELVVAAGGSFGTLLLGVTWYLYNTFDVEIEEADQD